MIYTFKRDFPLKDGSIIKKGDSVFLDNPDEKNEITEAVEADKSEPKKKAPKE